MNTKINLLNSMLQNEEEVKYTIAKDNEGFMSYIKHLTNVSNFLFSQGKKAGIKKECIGCSNKVEEGTKCEREFAE